MVAIVAVIGPLYMAGEFTVFSTKGPVTAGNKKLVNGDKVANASPVNIGSEGKLVLIDEENQQIVTVTGPASGKASEVVKSAHSSQKPVTAKYLAYMKQRIADKGDQSSHMQSAGSVYRDPDSLANAALNRLAGVAPDTITPTCPNE